MAVRWIIAGDRGVDEKSEPALKVLTAPSINAMILAGILLKQRTGQWIVWPVSLFGSPGSRHSVEWHSDQ